MFVARHLFTMLHALVFPGREVTFTGFYETFVARDAPSTAFCKAFAERDTSSITFNISFVVRNAPSIPSYETFFACELDPTTFV